MGATEDATDIVETSTHTQLAQLDKDRKFREWWTRWKREYLAELNSFHAPGKKSRRSVVFGEIVTIHDEKPKRIKWRTGVVVGLTRGRDGKCCRERLRMWNGNLIDWPVQRLFLLNYTQLMN